MWKFGIDKNNKCATVVGSLKLFDNKKVLCHFGAGQKQEEEIMKRVCFLAMSFLLALAVMPAWANQSAPSASASAAQSQTATVVSAPTLAPSASASSNQTTGVAVQANPTALAGGGTGIGIGGQGGQGGRAVVMLDQSRGDTVSYNRQMVRAPLLGTNLSSYYGGFEKGPWNVTDLIYGMPWRVNPRREIKIDYVSIMGRVYQKLKPVSRVMFFPRGMTTYYGEKLLRTIVVRVTEEQSTDDVQTIIASEAAKIGGNVVEVISSSATITGHSRGYHVGTGITGSGIISNGEKMSAGISSGFGYGDNKIFQDHLPFMSARIWHASDGMRTQLIKELPVYMAQVQERKNGATAPKISVKKLEEK